VSRKEEKQYTTIHGDIIVVREKSILLAGIKDADTWVPRSVIRDSETIEEEDDVDLDVETWFCQKEDLI
jgi:hypothetical protein